MHVRCSYCSHSFNLNRDFIAQALDEAAEARQKYVGVECINCRKLIKVPVKQMRRYAPRPDTADAEQETPTGTD